MALDCLAANPFRLKALTQGYPTELEYSSLTYYYSYPPSPSPISFNDLDQVAFVAKTVNPKGIFLYDGTSAQEVFLEKGLTADAAQMNTQGHMAFRVYDKSTQKYALYLFTGESSQKIYDDVQDFSLNNQDQIVFSSSRKLFFYDGTQITNISSLGEFLELYSFSLNNQGQVAFLAYNATSLQNDLMIFAAGQMTNVTAGKGVTLSKTSTFFINDQGQLAFIASDSSNKYYLFFYDGRRLSNLTLNAGITLSSSSSFRLNNKGQIAFLGTQAFFFYDGANIINITQQTGISPYASNPLFILNDQSQVAFFGYDNTTKRNGLFLFANQAVNNITAGIKDISGLHSFFLNNKGQLAFQIGEKRDATYSSNIYFFNGTHVLTVSTSPPRDYTYPYFILKGLNEMGQILFSDSASLYLYDGVSTKNLATILATHEIQVNIIDKASLNEKGQVAFSGSKVYSYNSADIFLYQDDKLINLTARKELVQDSAPYSYSLPRLNNLGHMVYWGSKSAYSQEGSIYFYDGSSLKEIIKNPPFAVKDLRLNDQDHIVIRAPNDIYLFDGTRLRHITANNELKLPSSSYSDPIFFTFNNQDHIAIRYNYYYSYDKQGNILYFFDGNTLKEIYRNTSPVSLMLDMNNKGHLTFSSAPEGYITDLYLYDGSTITNLTNTAELSESYPAINDKDVIAFQSYTLYSGADTQLSLYADNRISELFKTKKDLEGIRDNIQLKDNYLAFEGTSLSSNDWNLYLYDGKKLHIVAKLGYGNYLLNGRARAILYTTSAKEYGGLTPWEIYMAVPLPLADAGPDQMVTVGSKVILDGSSSYDIDGDQINYHWVMLSRPVGSNATLSDPTASNPNFIADTPGIYELQLMVDDGKERSEANSVLITVVDAGEQKPIAYAGPDRVVTTGTTITLDSSASYNPSGDDLSYSWSLLRKPSDSQATLSDSASKNPSLPIDKDGLYEIDLVVKNSQGQNVSDTINIFALGKDTKVMVKANKSEYRAGDTLELFLWKGNSKSGKPVTADIFIGFGLPDGSLYFFDPALILKPSNSTNPRSFTPFAEAASLIPDFVFPDSVQMNADSDANGKLDTFQFFSVTLPPTLPAGEYFAFAALAEPGSVQAGSPRIVGDISLASFSFTR